MVYDYVVTFSIACTIADIFFDHLKFTFTRSVAMQAILARGLGTFVFVVEFISIKCVLLSV